MQTLCPLLASAYRLRTSLSPLHVRSLSSFLSSRSSPSLTISPSPPPLARRLAPVAPALPLFLGSSRLFQRLFLSNYTTSISRSLRIRHDPLFSYVTPSTSLPPSHPWIDIAYTLHGNGPQKLLFIPGMCVSSAMWHCQVAAFAADPRYTLLLIDNRGTGASSCALDGYDMLTMARDAWTVADAVFGKQARIHLVGHSMGSMIAQRAALMVASPDRIVSLSLLSGHDGGWFWSSFPTREMIRAAFDLARARFDEETTAAVHMRLHYTDRFLDASDEEDGGGPSKGARRPRYYQRYLDGIRAERKRDAATPGKGDTFWTHLGAVRSHALSDKEAEKLRAATYPKLVVYGRKDPVVLPRASEEMGRRIGAEVVAVDGAHFIIEEAAEGVNKLLRLQVERAGDDSSGWDFDLAKKVRKVAEELGGLGKKGKECK